MVNSTGCWQSNYMDIRTDIVQ